MADARRYILECTTTRPSGLTTVTLPTVSYNLINGFSGTRDTPEGGSFSYQNISLEDLTLLSEEQYNQRVSDFLIYVQVETTARRATLLSEATFEDPSC